MNTILKVVDQTGYISSRKIAQMVGVTEKNMLDLVKKYRKNVEAVGGKVAFETLRSISGRSSEEAILNEAHATFVMTLLRNSKRVVSFKASLVKDYMAMKYAAVEQAEHKSSLLLNDNNKLRESRESTIANPRASLAKATRNERLAWVARGWLIDTPKESVKHVYTLTGRGEAYLTKTRKGTIHLK